MMESDKEVERSRYNLSASDLLYSQRAAPGITGQVPCGALAVPVELRSPYIFYESLLGPIVFKSQGILEICAGTGMHSNALLASGTGKVICSDISEQSLQILQRNFSFAGERLSIEAADMECLPFDDGAFDLVACAGGLSYGDPKLVMQEVRRVLRAGGHFVCVDSFNENPVYRFNRWLHFLRGDRSRSTLRRMPCISTIQAYRDIFSTVEVRYFGALSWLSPVLKLLIGDIRTARFVDRADDLLGVYRSAFKFVMVAQK